MHPKYGFSDNRSDYLCNTSIDYLQAINFKFRVLNGIIIILATQFGIWSYQLSDPVKKKF